MLQVLVGDYSVINFIITINRVSCFDVDCWADVLTRIHLQDYLEEMNNDL